MPLHKTGPLAVGNALWAAGPGPAGYSDIVERRSIVPLFMLRHTQGSPSGFENMGKRTILSNTNS